MLAQSHGNKQYVSIHIYKQPHKERKTVDCVIKAWLVSIRNDYGSPPIFIILYSRALVAYGHKLSKNSKWKIEEANM